MTQETRSVSLSQTNQLWVVIQTIKKLISI